jgi:precorrin-2 dehydrogenase/sirohydrochlorin ferrochelatase
MTYYPVFLNLRNKKCVVIGGGRVAERKTRQLLQAGADITLISPGLTPGLDKLVLADRVRHKRRSYRNGDTKNAYLVIAATSSEHLNGAIANNAPGLANAVDMPDFCSFIMPSVLRKGPLTIAVSSSGISPALSKTLRKDLEACIPATLPAYLAYLKKIRPKIMKALPRTTGEITAKRSHLLKELGSPRILTILKQKGLASAKKYVEAIIQKNI